MARHGVTVTIGPGPGHARLGQSRRPESDKGSGWSAGRPSQALQQRRFEGLAAESDSESESGAAVMTRMRVQAAAAGRPGVSTKGHLSHRVDDPSTRRARSAKSESIRRLGPADDSSDVDIRVGPEISSWLRSCELPVRSIPQKTFPASTAGKA